MVLVRPLPPPGQPGPQAVRFPPKAGRCFCSKADDPKAKVAAEAAEAAKDEAGGDFKAEAFEQSTEGDLTGTETKGGEAGDEATGHDGGNEAIAEEEEVVDWSPVLGAPQLRPPPSWRRSSPGHWVDLEFDRAGLPEDAKGPGALSSPWKEHPQPELGVLWPHAAIDDHRSRGFALPEHLQEGDASSLADAGKKLKENRDRMQELWRMSGSHGISWDELDEAYVQFAKDGKSKFDKWSRQRKRKEEDAHFSEDKFEIMAVEEKALALREAERILQKFTPPDDEGNEQRPLEVFPSRTKRLQSRIYRQRKKRWLGPWAPGKLTASLRELVAARMLRRETEDRIYGLRGRGS